MSGLYGFTKKSLMGAGVAEGGKRELLRGEGLMGKAEDAIKAAEGTLTTLYTVSSIAPLTAVMVFINGEGVPTDVYGCNEEKPTNANACYFRLN